MEIDTLLETIKKETDETKRIQFEIELFRIRHFREVQANVFGYLCIALKLIETNQFNQENLDIIFERSSQCNCFVYNDFPITQAILSDLSNDVNRQKFREQFLDEKKSINFDTLYKYSHKKCKEKSKEYTDYLLSNIEWFKSKKTYFDYNFKGGKTEAEQKEFVSFLQKEEHQSIPFAFDLNNSWNYYYKHNQRSYQEQNSKYFELFRCRQREYSLSNTDKHAEQEKN